MPEPILTVAEMRAREARTWTMGVPPEAVIERAGQGVAAVALRETHEGAPILVLAGKGHNGDDALVAAAHLPGREVVGARLDGPQAFAAAHDWLERHRGRRDALIIDGLFGIGVNRPLTGEWAALVDEVNESGVRVLSVDVPSGLSADTGEAMGESVIVAAITVTLGAPKAGLIVERSAAHTGRIELAADIGLVSSPESAAGDLEWVMADDFADWPPARPWNAHKGTFGHLAIVAGSLGYHGAAVLAAQGALRARPGLVTVFTDERCYLPVASQLRAAMVQPWSGAALPAEAYTAIVLGPGLASPGLPAGAWEEVRRLWRSAACVVLADASALDRLPREIDETAGPRVITPHPGEAARLLGTSAAEVQADREGALRSLSGRWGGRVWVVLKGRHTLVGRRDGVIAVNSTGNPGLAQGGTGDVLAGFLGGGLARTAGSVDPGFELRHGVWAHGRAADQLERRGGAWTTEDLVEVLGGSPEP